MVDNSTDTSEFEVQMTDRAQTPNRITAEIDDKVKQYLFWTVMWISAVTVVGIPLLPIIAIIYWAWYAPRYLEFHTLELSDTGVQSKRGVIFRSQTNVPLDRITDVAVHQGPLMRTLDVYKVTIESAGQTQLQGAANIIGVIDPYAFRDAVLENVEMLRQRTNADMDRLKGDPKPETDVDAQTQLLTEIRDILAKLEARRS